MVVLIVLEILYLFPLILRSVADPVETTVVSTDRWLIKFHQSWHFAFGDNESQFDKYIYIHGYVGYRSPLPSCFLLSKGI